VWQWRAPRPSPSPAALHRACSRLARRHAVSARACPLLSLKKGRGEIRGHSLQFLLLAGESSLPCQHSAPWGIQDTHRDGEKNVCKGGAQIANKGEEHVPESTKIERQHWQGREGGRGGRVQGRHRKQCSS